MNLIRAVAVLSRSGGTFVAVFSVAQAKCCLFRRIFGVPTGARGGGRGAPQAGGEEGGAAGGRRWGGAPQAGGCEKSEKKKKERAGIGRDKKIMYCFS